MTPPMMTRRSRKSCTVRGKDNYTEAGTWITYNGKESIAAVTNDTIANNLGGIFVFNTSKDTVNSGGQFTYELMNQMANQLDAASPTPTGDLYVCVDNQCVASSSGVSQDLRQSICGPQKYRCTDNQCVVSSDGVDEDTCKSICGSIFSV